MYVGNYGCKKATNVYDCFFFFFNLMKKQQFHSDKCSLNFFLSKVLAVGKYMVSYWLHLYKHSDFYDFLWILPSHLSAIDTRYQLEITCVCVSVG